MKDYSAMSDYDINLLVNRSLGLKHYPNEEKKVIEVFGDIVIFDPCNNPADAWPIILSERISIEHDGDCWRSDLFNENGGYEAESDSPLRAAMTVFLMMKDAEKCDG